MIEFTLLAIVLVALYMCFLYTSFPWFVRPGDNNYELISIGITAIMGCILGVGWIFGAIGMTLVGLAMGITMIVLERYYG